MKEIAIVSMAAGVAYLVKELADFSTKRLPPGPKRFPLIGHILSIPRTFEHVAYANMGKELNSDIVALTAMGQTIVVLNSAEATSELLDKRSSIYSGRAQIPAVTDKEMMDWGQGIVFLNNGDRWRRDRRMLHEALHKGVVPRYYPAQEKQIQALVGRLLNTPSTLEVFIQELRFAFGATLLYSTYGYLPTSPDDDWIIGASAATDHIAQAAQPTKFIVNFIPVLKYLPNWFPGTGWKRTLSNWRQHKEHTTAAPYNWTKEQIGNGTAVPSIVQNLLSAFPDYTPDTEDDVHIKLMSATMFGGGLETSIATASFFILAMVLYPEIALKIQEEVDQVLGTAERLPTMHDREQLPYIQNTLLELLRWQPVNPLAIPHAAMEDGEYKGYHIPKDSIVIGNTWAITRDENIYPDPECFNPDRFLDPKVPPAPAFGYGRRCVTLI
ncbi:O-methylsterigmatocystin oxidoreductase [Rhizoctonia solani]|uniref:O-methylsterigmatocystin oxidoreductase n=1 Tax=Rhizoctonia solani TaxID=456999 RepID=A0A0K6G0N8_9AGAM|nr:O-methylsterigmatocystin oxidoreductase [Rhizoctonia solani]